MPSSSVQIDAFVSVLHRAMIESRLLAYHAAYETAEEASRKSLKQIAALLDAVHNVPLALHAPEGLDADHLLGDLQAYDEEYADGMVARSSGLASVYRDELKPDEGASGEA